MSNKRTRSTYHSCGNFSFFGFGIYDWAILNLNWPC